MITNGFDLIDPLHIYSCVVMVTYPGTAVFGQQPLLDGQLITRLLLRQRLQLLDAHIHVVLETSTLQVLSRWEEEDVTYRWVRARKT